MPALLPDEGLKQVHRLVLLWVLTPIELGHSKVGGRIIKKGKQLRLPFS
jgi:hypothetical protein